MTNASRPTGPNVRKLIATKIAREAIPDKGGFADGLRFLSSKDRILAAAKAATAWVFAAIDAVKSAPDGGTYGDDEAIAGEILRRLDNRKKSY
jgi:hypothetical protein